MVDSEDSVWISGGGGVGGIVGDVVAGVGVKV